MNWINAWWQDVSATAANGLQITVVGMALVFLTLGLIIVALVLLTRLPGLSKKPKKEQEVATSSPPQKPDTSMATDVVPTETGLARDAELAHVAAIAVAVLRGRLTKQPRLIAKAETSRWKQYGRAHQLGL